MNTRTPIAQALAAAAVLLAFVLPSPILAGESEAPPFDACVAVGVRAAANLIGGPIRNAKPNYRQTESTPRQQSLCSYDGVNNGQLSVLLLRYGDSEKDRRSLAAFRSSYERAATAQYGKPSTTTDGDVTIDTFQTENGAVVDVAAFTDSAVARITLTFGKARKSELDTLATSLVLAAYGPAPTPSPSVPPDLGPCGKRATHATSRG